MSSALAIAIGKMLLEKLKAFIMGDEPDKGEWSGRYNLTPVPYGNPKKRIWYFTNGPLDPLRWTHAKSGYQFRSGDGMTDGGSIPFICQKLPRKYLRLDPYDNIEAYVLHDFGCRNRFIFVRKSDDGPWHMMKTTKKQADVLLWWTLSSKSPTTGVCPTRLEAVAISRAVRAEHALHGE